MIAVCSMYPTGIMAQDDLEAHWARARQITLMTDSAGVALRAVIRLADDQKVDSISAEARYLLGKHYFLRMHDTLARRYFGEARNRFIRAGNWEKAGFSCVQDGLSYIQDHLPDSAVVAFHRAIAIYETHGLGRHRWTPHIGLSNVYAQAGEITAAFDEARLAVEALTADTDRAGQVITLGHIVQLARDYDSLSVYAAYADRLLRIYSPLEIDTQVPQHAEYFIRRADASERDSVIRSFIARLEAYPPTLEIVSAYYQLGRTLAESGRTAEAIDAYAQSYAIERKITGNPHFAPLLLRALSDLHAKTGRYADAFDLLQRYGRLKDSLTQASMQERIADLQVQYATARKDMELARQRTVLERRTRESNTILGLALGVLAMALFAFYMLRRHARDLATINRQREALHARELDDLRHHHAIDQLHTLVTAQEEERQRIAQDLHDSLGGLLASLKIHFRQMADRSFHMAERAAEDHLRLIDTVSAETRRIAHNMMPTALSRMGLAAAIQDMVRLLEREGRLDVTFQNIDFHDRIGADKEIGLYRIAQELCANVTRHADARHLLIQLSRHNGTAALVVEDDGCGFDPDMLGNGLGLESIRSRVAYLHGDLDIVSSPGEGTSVTVQIPVS